MKTLAEIDAILEKFEKQFGLEIRKAQQGSEIWMRTKLGVISASCASEVVAKKTTATRHTYMCFLVAQVCTGVFEEVNARAMDWGKQHEAAARSAYTFASGEKGTQISFVFKDESFRTGCSPDDLLKTKGAEIKCPFNSENYIKFAAEDKIKPEWEWQNNFSMWVCDADEWDMVQYDPRMKKHPQHIVTVSRDVEKIKALDDLVPAFIHDMDQMLAKFGVRFGDQWKL